MSESQDTQERTEIPTTDDPSYFMEEFKRSNRFAKAFEEFFKNKKPLPSVTQERMEKVFLESTAGKFAILDFGRRDLHFKFNSSVYKREFLTILKEYFNHLKDIKKLEKTVEWSQDMAIAMDQIRRSIHNSAAHELMREEIVHNEKMGRAVVSLIAVDCGYETFAYARKSDI